MPKRPPKRSAAAAKVATNPAGEPGSPKRKKWVEAAMKRASEAEAKAADEAARRFQDISIETELTPYEVADEHIRLRKEFEEEGEYLARQDRITELKKLGLTAPEIRKEMLKFEDEISKTKIREMIIIEDKKRRAEHKRERYLRSLKRPWWAR